MPSSPPPRCPLSLTPRPHGAGWTVRGAPLIDKRSAPSILTPHDSEYARISGSAPTATAWRGRALAAATGAVVLAEGTADGRGRTGVTVPHPTCSSRPPAGPRWPRPAAVTCSRGSSAPSARAACRRPRRRRWPRTCTAGPRRSAVRGAGGGRPAPPGGALLSEGGGRAMPEGAPGALGRHAEARRRPWPRAVRARPGPRSTWPRSPTTRRCWPAWPRRPSCVPWSRRTATGTVAPPWPGRPGRGPRAWPWRWSTRAWSCACTASTAPVLLLSECGADAATPPCPTGSRPRCTRRGRCRLVRRGAAAAGRRSASTSRSTPACTASVRRPSDLPRDGGAVVADPSLRARGAVDPPPRGRRRERRTARSPRASSPCSTTWWPSWPRPASGPVAPCRQHGGSHRLPRARHDMVRCGLGLYGYLPGRSVQEAFDAQAGGEQLRPAMSLKARVVAVRVLAGGGAPLLRPAPPAADALARGHGPHRVRRRRAPQPLRRRLRGAHRGRAPAPGRDGDHGPARGRLR